MVNPGWALPAALLAAFLLGLAARRRIARAGGSASAGPGPDMPGRADLGVRLPKPGLLAADAGRIRRVNALLGEAESSLSYLFSSGLAQTRISDSVKRDAAEMVNTADRTERLAITVAATMSEMSAAVREIAVTVDRTGSARSGTAGSGHDDDASSLESVRRLSGQIASWAGTNRALSEASGQIASFVGVINEIARQTNLLALNAAIEAARAGDKGRGFAVVAGEVRKLADRTSQYTREIAGTIDVIREQAGNSLQNMELTLKSVGESIEKAEETDRSLQEITSKAAKIAHVVSSSMEEVSSQATKARLLAERITESGEAVARGTLDVYSRLCAFRLDDSDRAVEHLLLSAAREFRERLLRDLDSGRVSLEDLFDEAYAVVDEGKHANRSSAYFRAGILPLLKRWSAGHPSVIYVVGMDRKGFMPVHLMPARTGVIMKDPVSQAGARSDRILGQAFRRPIEAGGELVVDVAHPIAIRGRHWGCLRIGYLPATREAGSAASPPNRISR